MSDLELEQDLAKKRLDRATLFRMLALVKPVRGLLYLVMLFDTLLIACVFSRPKFIEIAIDDGLIAQPGGGFDIDMTMVLLMALALVGVWVGRFLCFIVSRYAAGVMAFRVLNDLRQQLFAHVHSLSMRFFDKTKVGRIVSRADSDVNSLEQAIIEGPVLIYTMILRFALSSIVLYMYCPPVLYALVPILPVLAIAMLIFQKFGTKLWAHITEARSRVTAHLVETIGGVRVVQQLGHEQINRDRYQEQLDELDRRVRLGAFGWSWFFPFLILMFMTGLTFILWQGGQALRAGALTVGEFTTCVFYVFYFLGPLADLGMLYERLAQGIAAAQRIFLLLDTDPEILDKESAYPLQEVKGAISFEQVRFAYNEGDWVLHGIDLEVPAGQTLAIVGPTGHGKSTMVQLLARFYDIQEGRIRIDGHDISQVTQESLHRQIGVVLQDNVLFSGTILDNLRVAQSDASDEQLIQACRDLCADEIIERLPNGYQTQVGARGDNLSHGQRQLVCLVRAYLADPAVLVLDEATSSIDVYTEQRVQRALRRLCEGRTAIIIAHRLATIRDADRIIVINSGLIVESGTHDELMDAGGKYASLYDSYQKGFEI